MENFQQPITFPSANGIVITELLALMVSYCNNNLKTPKKVQV